MCIPSKGRLLWEQMYAILQIVNLWSPNPIQYNLVSYKSFEESTTKCFAAAERGAPLTGCGMRQLGALRISIPAADPIWPRHLHSPRFGSSSWNPTHSLSRETLSLNSCLQSARRSPGERGCAAINTAGTLYCTRLGQWLPDRANYTGRQS